MEVKRWYEHNHLDNDMATLAFIREWIKVLDWGVKHLGMDYHEDKNGDLVKLPFPYQGCTIEYFQSVNDGEDWRHFTRLREMCDRKLLPYYTFCSVAVRVLFGMDRVELNIAQVRQTIVLASVMEQVREDAGTGKIVMAKDPYFKAPAYRETPLQEAYFQYVVQSILKKYKHGSREILERLVKSDTLPEKFLNKVVD
jgi:hypothetical protein